MNRPPVTVGFQQFPEQFRFIRRLFVPRADEPDTSPVHIGLYQHHRDRTRYALAVSTREGHLSHNHGLPVVLKAGAEDVGEGYERIIRRQYPRATTQTVLELALYSLKRFRPPPEKKSTRRSGEQIRPAISGTGGAVL